ncbi:MAG TPA: DUF3786 domain-containing protein [Thermodesulfovibrionales bacterium]|nr:DUF3786 domain-containing protein [Thermodesulfovibrionales bacterium]
MITPGEEKAWEILAGLDPSLVCKNASVTFEEQRHSYIVRSFCYDYSVSTKERIISSDSPQGESLAGRYPYFFLHSCLWYLIHAKDIAETNRLVRPGDIKGGELFFRGSHVLPLNTLAERYAENGQAFLNRGEHLCADPADYGDVSIRLRPMPRIPATLVLWLGDDEFPSRAALLFDSSCGLQVPIDIVWSMAMLTVLAAL